MLIFSRIAFSSLKEITRATDFYYTKCSYEYAYNQGLSIEKFRLSNQSNSIETNRTDWSNPSNSIEFSDQTIELLRERTNKNWALGDQGFCSRLEMLSDRRALPSCRGGDRKSKQFKTRRIKRV